MYFDINSKTNGYLVNSCSKYPPHSTPILLNLQKIDTWEQFLGKYTTSKYLTGQKKVYVLIPYHNSSVLSKVIKDIVYQNIPSIFSKTIIIIASNCNNKFINLAYKTVAEFNGVNNWRVEIFLESTGGKPRALNTGIKKLKANQLVIQLVDDIRIDKNLVSLFLLALETYPDYGAVCSVGYPTYPKNKLLKDVQRIHYKNFYINDCKSLMGRAFAFKLSILPRSGFPEKIMGEDFWLEMQTKIKSKGFLVLANSFIKYKTPANFNDYLRQIDRFDGAYKQLKREYPHYFYVHLNHKPLIKNRFLNMIKGENTRGNSFSIIYDYIFNEEFSFISKIVYILVVCYRLYYLKIKNSIFPTKAAFFRREVSTTI